SMSLHDALPIFPVRVEHGSGFCEHCSRCRVGVGEVAAGCGRAGAICDLTGLQQGIAAGVEPGGCQGDRKSTRLNSSHVKISYAVFCLKKKKKTKNKRHRE